MGRCILSTVLIIEDQPELGSILRLVVSRRGHRALLATSIAEAHSVWRSMKTEIDLVIADNLLPDGSGIQFAATLTAEKPSLKLIIATGLPEGSIPAGAHRMDNPSRSPR